MLLSKKDKNLSKICKTVKMYMYNLLDYCTHSMQIDFAQILRLYESKIID